MGYPLHAPLHSEGVSWQSTRGIPLRNGATLRLLPIPDVATFSEGKYLCVTPALPKWLGAIVLSLLLHAIVIFGVDWTNVRPPKKLAFNASKTLSVGFAFLPKEPSPQPPAQAVAQPGDVPAVPENPEQKAGPLVPEPAQMERVAEATANNPFGPWYYPAHYLHIHPTPLKPIQPQYPPEALDVSGHVKVLLYIGFGGSVDKYEIVESDPKGVFDNSVIEAFASAQYAPGQIIGYPVRSQLLVEVTYDHGQEPRALVSEPPVK